MKNLFKEGIVLLDVLHNTMASNRLQFCIDIVFKVIALDTLRFRFSDLLT